MTIIKVSKQRFKKNFYTVIADDGNRVSCSDEIIVRYGIAPGAEFDQAAFAAIVMDAQRALAMDTAIRLLGMQPRSRGELAGKLKIKKFAPAVIESVLSRIEDLGYLNDRAFALNRATMLAAQGKGPDLIKYELLRKGISKEILDVVLSELTTRGGEDETLGPIRLLAKKHLRKLQGQEPRVIAHKLMGFLARRGYDLDTCRTIIRELRADQSGALDEGETHD